MIVAVLRAIRESQKKLKVKTSKYLKQLESFLFQINKKMVTEEEIKLLLLGNEEKGLPYVSGGDCASSILRVGAVVLLRFEIEGGWKLTKIFVLHCQIAGVGAIETSTKKR